MISLFAPRTGISGRDNAEKYWPFNGALKLTGNMWYKAKAVKIFSCKE
jgi:hypothetical protein